MKTQLRLEAFYTFNEKFAKIRSKRIKNAVKGMSGMQSSELMDDVAKDNARNKKKRTGSAGELLQHKLAKPSNGTDEASPGRSTQGQTRKRKASGQPTVTEGKHLETNKLAARKSATKRSRGNRRGGGTGRSSKTSQRGISASRISEGSSVDDSSDDNELEACDEKLDVLQVVRRVS